MDDAERARAERHRYLGQQVDQITGWMAEAGVQGVIYLSDDLSSSIARGVTYYVTEACPPADKAAVVRRAIEALQSWLVELEGEGDGDG